MLVNLQTILKDADERGYAVPAFNVYNMETVMGVIKAAEELRAPVIIQFYSRLATTVFADFTASAYNFADSAPMSSPILSAGIASAATFTTSISASIGLGKDFAATESTGSKIFLPSAFAFASISLQ